MLELFHRLSRQYRRNPWLALLTLWCAALAVRAVVLWEVRGEPLLQVTLGDAWSYDTWAREIAAGDWLGSDVFYQAPLYPYALAAVYATIGHSLWGVRMIQVLLGASSCVLLAVAGRQFFSRRVGLIAGWMFAVYPTAIYFDLIIQKTALSSFLFCGLLCVLGFAARRPDRLRWWIAGGGVLALLVLARENAMVFAPLTVAWILLGLRPHPFSRRAIWSAMFLCGWAVCLSPVVLRNYHVAGEWHITTSQFGPNFYIGNHAAADGRYRPLRTDRGHARHERTDAVELAEAATGRALTAAEVSDYWANRAWKFIRDEPGAWLRLMARKCLLLVNSVEIGDTEDQYTYAESSLVLKMLTALWHFGVLFPLAVLGIVCTRRLARRLSLLYLFLAGYALSVVVFFVFSRYRFPLVPLLLLFAAAAVWRLRAWAALRQCRRTSSGNAKGRRRHGGAKRRSLAPLLISCAAVVAAAAVANWPLLSWRDMQVPTYYNLGNELLARGERAAAIGYYRQALSLAPDHGAAHLRLAAALDEAGDEQAAFSHFREAVRWRPNNAWAHYRLGVLLLRGKQYPAAERHLRAAVRLDAEFAEASCALGNVLVAGGRFQESTAHYRHALALEPDYVEAHSGLGVALAQQSKLAEAKAHFARWTELAPRSAEAHLNLGSVLLSMNDLAAAEARLRAAVELDAASPLARNNLAVALARQQKRDEAIAQLEIAVQLAPAYAAARALLDELRAQEPRPPADPQ